MIPRWIGEEKVDDGRIVQRTRTGALVVLNPDCAEPVTCALCRGRDSCAKAAKPATVTVPDTSGSALHAGERVKIEHFAINPALAAFLVFGNPLLLTLVALWLVWAFGVRDTDSMWTVAAAFVGFLSGFLVSAAFDRIVARLSPSPKVVSRVDAR